MKIRFLFFTLVLFIIISCQDDNEENFLLGNKPNTELKSANYEQYRIESDSEFKIGYGKNDAEFITIQETDNRYITGGDILLTEEQIQYLKDSNSDNTKSTGLSSFSKRWPNCKVYYKISPSLPNPERVTDAIAHWEAEYDIDFVVRARQSNYIEFVPGAGCASYLGMIGGRQEIYLGTGCTAGNTIHEIGHALGLLHEQQRNDRSNSISINWGNIEAGYEDNFETYGSLGTNAYEINNFDFGSIMLYGSFAFSKNGLPTITKLDGSTFNGQRVGLSIGDLDIIDDMYGCDSSTGTITCPDNNCIYINPVSASACGDISVSLNCANNVTSVDWSYSIGPYSDINEGTTYNPNNNYSMFKAIFLPSGNWDNYYLWIYANVTLSNGNTCLIQNKILMNCSGSGGVH